MRSRVACAMLKPRVSWSYNGLGSPSLSSLKKLSDSEVITLALFQQLRGVES